MRSGYETCLRLAAPMRCVALAAVLFLAACTAPAPREQALQAAYAAAQAEASSLELRLRESEEARQQAESRAKELEQARDLNDKLSADLRRLEAQVAALKAHETEHGWILTLGSDVLFDVGDAKLKPEGKRAISTDITPETGAEIRSQKSPPIRKR